MRRCRKNKRNRGLLANESGAIAIIVALMLPVFVGMTGMAFDYGSMFMVQHELKKAAEAGALAGARALVPYVGTPPQPNWSQAQMVATSTVRLNQAAGKTLTDCTVTYGYWSTSAKTLQSAAITPTSTDIAAIQVVVAKGTENNGGPFELVFLSLLPGVPPTKDLSGTAVAIIPFPLGMPPGSLVPLAASKTIVDLFWNQSPPVSFKIGSSGDNGQWTSFKVDNNSARYAKDLIDNGNPTTLSLNDNIYIQPGAEAALYGDLGDKYNHATVVIPLVDPPLDSKTDRPVKGFVAFYIEDYSQGGKYIEGHFDKNYCITNPNSVGAPISPLSTTLPPKLVN